LSTDAASGPALSVVVPVYRNAGMLRLLHERIRAVLAPEWESSELIFVIDASPDDSEKVARQIARADCRVRVLPLGNNAGQNAAILAGLREATGGRTVVMDADLQDPPEAIPLLLERLEKGLDVVFAGRRGRYESAFRLLTSRLWKYVLHLASGRRVPPDAGLFLAMNQAARDYLRRCSDREPYIIGMLGRSSLLMQSVPVERQRREQGSSAYSSGMRLRLAWRGLRALARSKHRSSG
jgi:glycosyltransferase involved in cell wall biosynthesis